MVYEMPVDPRPYWIWCHLVLPETGEAKGTDDLKHRLLSQSLVIVGSEPKVGTDAYHLRQSSFSALFSARSRISAGVLAYRSDTNLFSTVTNLHRDLQSMVYMHSPP